MPKWKCCNSPRFFYNANVDHLISLMVKYQFLAHQSPRKPTLEDILTLSWSFSFEGKQFCSEFLKKTFLISHDLRPSIKEEFRKDKNSTSAMRTDRNSVILQYDSVSQQPAAAASTKSSAVGVGETEDAVGTPTSRLLLHRIQTRTTTEILRAAPVIMLP